MIDSQRKLVPSPGLWVEQAMPSHGRQAHGVRAGGGGREMPPGAPLGQGSGPIALTL